MKIGVIGVGLIGGSLALSAREHIPDVELYGSNRSAANLKKSIDLGLIDQPLEQKMIKRCGDFPNDCLMEFERVFGMMFGRNLVWKN